MNRSVALTRLFKFGDQSPRGVRVARLEQGQEFRGLAHLATIALRSEPYGIRATQYLPAPGSQPALACALLHVHTYTYVYVRTRSSTHTACMRAPYMHRSCDCHKNHVKSWKMSGEKKGRLSLKLGQRRLTLQKNSPKICSKNELTEPHQLCSGLSNLGNTCYCNAILQALRHCPGFQQELRRMKEVVTVQSGSAGGITQHLSTVSTSTTQHEPFIFMLHHPRCLPS